MQSLACIGHGCPDLLVAFRMRTYLLEVKGPGGKLTEDEGAWIAGWRDRVHVVYGVDDALAAIGAIEVKGAVAR